MTFLNTVATILQRRVALKLSLRIAPCNIALLTWWQKRSVHTYIHPAYNWNLGNMCILFPESVFIDWQIFLFMLMSFPVWRIDISPFARNPLWWRHSSALPFSVNIAPYRAITLKMSIKKLSIACSFGGIYLLKMSCGKRRKWYFWVLKFEKFPGGTCL